MDLYEMIKQAGIDSPAFQASRNRQLHIAALGIAKTAGVKTAGEFDIATALHTLGAKRYMKRAQWNMIDKGLEALKELKDG